MSMARSDIGRGEDRAARGAGHARGRRATLLKLSSCDEIRHVPPRCLGALLALPLLACTPSRERPRAAPRDTVVVYTAASLAAPVRAVLDSFTRRTGAVIRQENGASIELARRITELHRVPDLVALADHEVFPELLVPGTTSWYTLFARNRMVVMYTDWSRGAAGLRPDDWYRVLLRPDVLVGRADPAIAPVGYRTLLVYRLAERYYHRPGLAARLADRSPPRLQRGNATELAALLAAGELDYVIDYESLARANHFRWLALPPEVDLSDPLHEAEYARDSVRVATRGGDSATRSGAPIVYGASVPRDAPHRDAGVRALAFLLGPEGQALLRAHDVDALRTPALVGDSIPDAVRRAAAP
jgi:molybdate/tungstate transport system substrate-binding protein